MDLASWAGSPDLSTPAGELLRQLVSLLPADQPALAERKRGHGEPTHDWKAELREAARS